MWSGRPRERKEIIATLGPSSDSPESWDALVDAGATQFRLNTSHIDAAAIVDWIERLRSFFASRAAVDDAVSNGASGGGKSMRDTYSGSDDASSHPFPVVLDLQGSKWRVGAIPQIDLKEGQRVRFVDPGDAGHVLPDTVVVPVPHADFFTAASVSDGAVLLNDGRVLVQLSRDRERGVMEGEVRRAGTITARKGITIASSAFRAEALSPKDRRLIEIAARAPHAHIAISYVRDDVEMRAYRETIPPVAVNGADGGPVPRYIVAKIERGTSMETVDGIADYADELWVCRGDLGAELGLSAMAREVRQIEHRLHGGTQRGFTVPVMLAGGVLEHMVDHSEPTRAEVCQLYDAFAAGYAGVVLSDETAIGKFPVDAVRIAALFS